MIPRVTLHFVLARREQPGLPPGIVMQDATRAVTNKSNSTSESIMYRSDVRIPAYYLSYGFWAGVRASAR